MQKNVIFLQPLFKTGSVEMVQSNKKYKNLGKWLFDLVVTLYVLSYF